MKNDLNAHEGINEQAATCKKIKRFQMFVLYSYCSHALG